MEIDKGKLAFLIGLPRSGKSSLASQWREGRSQFCSVRRNEDTYPNSRVVVEADKIRRAMGHRWNSFVEGHVSATKYTMIRALLYEHDVLVDGTHSKQGHIRRLFEIDNSAEFYFVDTPPSVCEQRAVASGQHDLIPVIDRIHKQLLDLVGVNHWDDMTSDSVAAAVNPIRLLAWEQVITD